MKISLNHKARRFRRVSSQIDNNENGKYKGSRLLVNFVRAFCECLSCNISGLNSLTGFTEASAGSTLNIVTVISLCILDISFVLLQYLKKDNIIR